MPDALAISRRQLLEAATKVSETTDDEPHGGALPEALHGADLGPVLQRYYRHVASEDLCSRSPEVLAGILRSHLALAGQRAEGAAAVRVYRPTLDVEGWTSSHTIVQVVVDDMPFLVDSVVGAVAAAGSAVHLVIHPVMEVVRNARGDLEGISDDPPQERSFGELRESWMSLEIDPLEDEAADQLTERVRSVLVDVRESVEDWPKMRQRAIDLADGLAAEAPAGSTAKEARLTAEFLRWMAGNHYTFLGYREYHLEQTDRGEAIAPDVGTGLGLLRSDPSKDPAVLTKRASRKAHEPRLLIVTKANTPSTVHRRVHLDYVSLKRVDDDGEVRGEYRFIGLFTSTAYTESVLTIPIVRDKVRWVLHRSGFSADSHSGKDLLGVLETYPRDELFQASQEDLYEVATAVLPLEERRTTTLFLRDDEFGRFVSAVVYLPRDHYNTSVRVRMADVLKRTFDGESVDYTARIAESTVARLHFVVRMPSGVPIPQLSEAQRDRLEERLVDAARTWDEKLHAAARAELDEDEGARLRIAYGKAFPTAYEQRFGMASTLADISHLEAVGADDDRERTDLTLYKGDSPDGMRRFKLFRRTPITLTTVLPVFTNLGVEVVDEQPYEVRMADGTTLHIYDFGLRVSSENVWSALPHEEMRGLFESAFAAVWGRQAESDGFNALVLGAGLGWRQVVVLRAVAKYLRQTRSTFSQDYLESTLVAHGDIARMLVELFETRFDPSTYAGRASSERDEAADAVAARVTAALDAVSSLDEDRIVRAFLAVIQAVLRTNYFQPGADDQPKAYLSMKIDPTAVPDLPAPRPAYEIWAYSPRVEGVHLRFGPVARGGLRWSDRREDFRTEVLGLVKAQMVKNAVIVPTGSKGGFFAKQLPDPAVDREAWMTEGVAAYTTFICGLLDITDNRLAGEIVAPTDVVRHDGDDPYLVVAADKGTATFSDIANEVAASYGFWLDDAFASGGSAGYDHKAMGITARGAWESVKRHFREMGVDTQTQEFTVVGVGDMSGDVFGNGMLLSEQIRLVAAFDHRHIFVDPTPDAATSFAERRRLFELPRSSWADYDTSLLGEGGGIFPRSLKSVPVTPQMATALGLTAGVTAMTPADLMQAILLAPVDLLWNGGIGTYVKATTETDLSVGDRANDSIRVDGHELRCKVVGEGGNLGLTQLGRIEASLHGIRVNTDAIDNSAGVDTSDHEVNIKILLGDVVRAGELDLPARNTLLASMTDDVAAHVLRDNYEQNVLLGNARAQEHAMVTVHERLIHWLEERGDLNRKLEFLPSDGDLARRAQEGLGLKSPEFSVLVAYAKLALKHDLLPGDLPDDPWFETSLLEYFPPPIRERYADELRAHPLRREIITNAVANSMVNRGGITFAFRAMEETGATAEQVARAFVVCREVFDLPSFVAAVEALDNVVPTTAQTALYLEFRRLLDRSVRWFLASRPGRLDIAAEIDRYASVVAEFAPRIPSLLKGAELRRLERRAKEFEKLGVPAELAVRAASLLDQYSLLDVVEIAAETDEPPESVASLYYVVSEKLGIDALLGRITKLPREDQWDSLARGAARDDLYAVLEALTRSVMEASQAQRDAEPAARYEVWAKANHDALHRAKTSLSEIAHLDAPNLAAVSVALRTLRSVTRSGSAST